MINFFSSGKNFSSSTLAGKVHSMTKQSDKNDAHWIDEEDDVADDIDYDAARPNKAMVDDEVMEEDE